MAENLPWSVARSGDEPSPPTGADARARERWRTVPGRIADTLWPPVCDHCGDAIAPERGLCAACWSRLALIERPFCERLGTPFALDLGGPLLSPAAIAHPPAYARARFVARYDDVARALVHRLKYGDQQELARTLGAMMARAGAELPGEADMIVPMPLHRLRFWRRQFNQAALLAAGIASAAGRPLRADLLTRRKATRPQVGLTRAERATNVAGAFAVPAAGRAQIAGRRILLVDDVVTTGATANAAAATLLRAGATAVDLVAFARVVPEGA